MNRVIEGTLWASAAIGLHAGLALWVLQSEGGPVSSGDTVASVAVMAADASVMEMVADWTRPPEVAPAPVMEMAPPVMSIEVPAMPVVPDMAALPVPIAPLAPPMPEAVAPEIVTTPAEPQIEVRMATDADPRPLQRPADLNEPAPRPTVAEAPQAAQLAPQQAKPAQASAASSGAVAPAASEGARQTAMSEWGGRVRAAVERRKTYPRAAGRATGVAVVRIRVSAAGVLQEASLAQSSGTPALDEAALGAAQAARYPAAPDALGQDVYTFNLPVNFAR